MALLHERAGSRREQSRGNFRMVSAYLDEIRDGDTWAPGLGTIERVKFVPRMRDPELKYEIRHWETRVLFSVLTEGRMMAGTITALGS